MTGFLMLEAVGALAMNGLLAWYVFRDRGRR